MRRRRGRMAARARDVRDKSGEELSAMFGAWVDLPKEFGGPRRRRLFFPLAGVLAVPVAGPVGGSGVPGDAARLPGTIGLGGEEGVASDGRILQGAKAAPPG